VKRVTPLVHLLGFMEIVVTETDERSRLVSRYRIALREWSLARFHHPSDSPEVIEAKRTLEILESELLALQKTAIVKYQPRQ